MGSMKSAHDRRGFTVHLTPGAQAKLQRLLRSRGQKQLRVLLGAGIDTLYKLVDGGHANPATVARLEERLAAVSVDPCPLAKGVRSETRVSD